jgi:hypothetical protein
MHCRRCGSETLKGQACAYCGGTEAARWWWRRAFGFALAALGLAGAFAALLLRG